MGTKQALQQVDPLSLPVGFQVGRWRVEAFGGRGAYGTLYCVEPQGREAQGPFALKLAIHPADARFEREGQLLSRLSSPHVPRFIEQGVWAHPSGAFPYLVMEWVAGELSAAPGDQSAPSTLARNDPGVLSRSGPPRAEHLQRPAPSWSVHP